MKKLAILFFIPTLILLNACAADIGADEYSSSAVGTVNKVSIGKIIAVRTVKVQDDDTSGGTTIGAIAGGIAGSQIGSGNAASLIGGAGGAILGGALGGLSEKSLSKQSGYEYIVQLDNGNIVTITQGTDVLLSVGQKCMILYGSNSQRARIIPYPAQ